MGMSEKEQTLTLSPRTLRLVVDGTAVNCRDWEAARKILANQARIHHRPVTVTVTDPEPAVTGHYTFDQAGQLLDATGAKDQPATMTLHEWVLQIPGHGAATFTELTTATARIEALAEATSTAITVTIEGAAPGGALTERYTPTEPAATPEEPEEDTPATEAEATDFDAELAQLLLAEIDSNTGALPACPIDPTPDTTDETETPAEAAEAPEDQAPEDQTDHSEDTGLDLFTTDPAEDEAEEEDPEDAGRKKVRRRLLGISAAVAVLLLIAGAGVATVIRSLPDHTTTATSTAPSTGWGQEVSVNSTPAVSTDHKHLAVTDDQGLTFVDTSTGQTTNSVDAVLTDRSTYPYGQSGFYVTGSDDHAPMLCTQGEDQFTCKDVAKTEDKQKLIHRAGTIAYASEDGKQVRVLNSDGAFTTFHAPDKNAAFIIGHQDQAIWATARKDGTGSLTYAATNGAVKKTVDLKAPADGAKILSWIGPTDQGTIAMLFSGGREGTDRLTFHNPDTGDVTKTVEIPTGASGDLSITDTGSLILAKARAVTSTGKAVDISQAKDMKTSGDVITNGETTVTGTGTLLTDTPHVVTTTTNGDIVVRDSHLETINRD